MNAQSIINNLNIVGITALPGRIDDYEVETPFKIAVEQVYEAVEKLDQRKDLNKVSSSVQTKGPVNRKSLLQGETFAVLGETNIYIRVNRFLMDAEIVIVEERK